MSIDPVSLAMVGLNIASSVAGAKSQEDTANQQAVFAEQKAVQERELEDIKARRIADENRRVQSRVIAQQTAGGGDQGSGSALLVQKKLAAEDSLEQSMALFEGETNAQSLEHQAQVQRTSASNLKSQAIFNAGTSLLDQFKGQSKFDLSNFGSPKKSPIGSI